MEVNPYKMVGNETATPLDLWVRGYRQILSQLKVARSAMELGNGIQRSESLTNAFSIVEFWVAALGAGEPESELGKRLLVAYSFLLEQITRANVYRDVQAIDEATKMLQHLHSVFLPSRTTLSR